jgi:hypothetical protein
MVSKGGAMPEALKRDNFDEAWFTAGKPRPAYTKFQHCPVEKVAARAHQAPVHRAGLPGAMCDYFRWRTLSAA